MTISLDGSAGCGTRTLPAARDFREAMVFALKERDLRSSCISICGTEVLFMRVPAFRTRNPDHCRFIGEAEFRPGFEYIRAHNALCCSRVHGAAAQCDYDGPGASRLSTWR